MSGFIFNSFFIFFAFFQFSMFSELSIQESPVLLLSFPRSGNTWIRYCIEYLTKRPTGEYEYLFPVDRNSFFMNNPINNIFDLGVDYESPPVVKSHFFNKKVKEYKIDYLIFVLRNYKESIPRHLGSFNDTMLFLEDSSNYYMHNLEVYDNWDPEKRIIIYYEELINDSVNVYKKLVSFFKGSDEYIEFFCSDMKIHTENAIQLYERDAGASYTKGKDVLFHSKKFSSEERKSIDVCCRKSNPNLFDKYLARYLEK